MSERIVHPFSPVYNAESRILILGSFPSAASRAQEFYYSHPRNRFWPLLAALLEVRAPQTIEEKIHMLLNHHIALYDAVTACTITGSADASMQSIIPSDLSSIFKEAPIQAVFANGTKAYEVCIKHIGISAIKLPSTSPANARFGFAELLDAWKQILPEAGLTH
ncbi:DNA-deoxyinosine glycosylase [Treponema sp. OMZ 855]|uniref:DNA-deoxyinosine glycosylase n=1 Tax=Treponema sp. OMZ 855 TaxID=1643512 RepID=UPI0020A5B4D1|nr:DNA-deoxyinosine glycosylase [Treponema sp. OMZ 855]UTC51715.1 DNA-deoxyinosine glycosylase [Treponema sp. OMZ 855]